MPAAETNSDSQRDFALAEAAAREAGTLARAHFHAMPSSWLKVDDSPVSEADHAVDRLLFARLAGNRPGYGWLSEETTDAPGRLERQRVWVVDPIDGTRSFLKSRDEWVVSVALIEDGAPVIGVVYNPLREEMFAAVRGQGATLNGKALTVSTTDAMTGCRLLANPNQIESRKWARPWPDMDIKRYNALAYRIVLVAAGTHDAALAFSRFHEWDVAAAELILREAGGVFTDFEGETFRYNQPNPRHTNGLAANPALHGAFRTFIADGLGG